MNMQPNQPSDSLLSKTQVIKPHNLKYYLKHILFNKITLLILIIIVIGGFILINNNLTPPTSQVKDGNLRITNVIYTPTPTEIIDIDSADDSTHPLDCRNSERMNVARRWSLDFREREREVTHTEVRRLHACKSVLGKFGFPRF